MSRVVPASSHQVFNLLAEYRAGHWRVLPPAFTDYRVLAGGIGKGTRIAFTLRAGRRTNLTEGMVTASLERLVLRRILRPICREEFALIADVAPRWNA